jgi:hypothetical protein
MIRTSTLRRCRFLAPLAFALTGLFALALPLETPAQEPTAPTTSTEALTNILAAACRANEAQFSAYLAGDNIGAFRALSPEKRARVIQRISLSDLAGKPLLVSGKNGLPALRCEGPSVTVEYHLGRPRENGNLAFIPVSVVDGADADFGLLHEASGWHLLSIGLVLFDIPQLEKQWAVADAAAREDAVVKDLRDLAEAVRRYNRVFGKLPETLEFLGPAPKDQVSAEQASLVDAAMAAGKKDGYAFRYRIIPDAAGNDANFELAATPQHYPDSGKRSFFLDSAGKIHGDDNQGAVATFEDPLIDGEKSE